MGLFSRIALVAAPLVVLVGVLLWADVGPWSSKADAERPFVPSQAVAAGEPLQVFGLDEAQVLWAQPGSVDVGSVTCASDDGQVAVDGAPEASGPAVREEPGGASWVRLTVLDPMLGAVTCDGAGVESIGVSDVDGSSSGAGGGAFFVVFGFVALGLGLLARRLTRQ
ncbi:hypothetical protein [Isoptericola croceus]|uniref:hypothetical protein n=1 Tax=Isoptericola croceus TaxID=3031406 RepID=UPI0023FA4790|nr:hypothetical protein [Isoptericola croceus]